MLDSTKHVKVVVYFLSLGPGVLEVQFGKSSLRVSNAKGIEVNIHSHFTAFRNDNIGHEISHGSVIAELVMVLPLLNELATQLAFLRTTCSCYVWFVLSLHSGT